MKIIYIIYIYIYMVTESLLVVCILNSEEQMPNLTRILADIRKLDEGYISIQRKSSSSLDQKMSLS